VTERPASTGWWGHGNNRHYLADALKTSAGAWLASDCITAQQQILPVFPMQKPTKNLHQYSTKQV
jgi:hypothetical protein